MNAIAMWFVLAALQIPAAPSAEAPPETPAFEPYDKSLAEGLDEVRGLSGAKKFDEAYALCGRLLAPTRFDAWRERQRAEAGGMKRVVEAATPAFDWLGVSGLSPEERAAVHYAEGVVASTAGDRARAEPVFQSARSLAGPGDVRLASIYNLGVNALLDGEEQRAKIPELQGGQAAPPAPPAAAPGAPPPPDPLDLARAAYLRAKTHLVERVRAQWDDADTRANIELVQRRLKELDEIQKKREEQKKKDEQEKQDEKDEKEKDEKKNPSDQKKDDEKEQEQKPDDSEKQDPKDDEKSENDKKDQEEPPKPEDAEQSKDEKPEEQKPEPQPSEESLEKLLTKEEMMRLLDVLKQHEEEYDKLKAQMRQSRRAKAKKDW